MDQQVVVFQIGAESFGIDIARVQEIRVVSPVTAVPGAPDFVKGMLNLRGKIAPVVDMHCRFNQPEVEHTRATRIIVVSVANGEWVGLVVDGVSEVVRIHGDMVEAPSALVSTVESRFISGIAKVTEEHLVILLDLDIMLETTIEAALPAEL
jgi:purine-binding chemotaxis protein CheW